MATIAPVAITAHPERAAVSTNISATIPQLDALRFGCFVLVFMVHNLPSDASRYPFLGEVFGLIASAGRFGVDVFFALSAYLITKRVIREREKGGLNIPRFYRDRAIRILPLLWGFLALVYALGSAGVIPKTDDSVVLLTAIGLGNFALLGGSAASMSIMPLWSVAVEKQFYAAWPWLTRAVAIRKLAIAMLALSFAARFVVGEQTSWGLTFTRLDPLALGALLATISMPTAKWAPLIGTGACGLIVAEMMRTSILWPVSYSIAAVASVALIIGAHNAPRPDRISAYLGRISYGLYVFHGLSMVLVGSVIIHGSQASYLGTVVVKLAITIILASASYHFFETRFLRHHCVR